MLQFHYHDFEFSFAYVSRRYFERNRPRDWGKSDSKEHFKRSFTNRGIPDEYSRILLLRTCNCQKDGERGRGEGGRMVKRAKGRTEFDARGKGTAKSLLAFVPGRSRKLCYIFGQLDDIRCPNKPDQRDEA